MSESGYTTHLFSYRYDGSEWSLEIPAKSAREAKERLGALTFARYDGELIAKVPVGAGPFVRLATWIRNVSRRS